jgi:hypothetical protein
LIVESKVHVEALESMGPHRSDVGKIGVVGELDRAMVNDDGRIEIRKEDALRGGEGGKSIVKEMDSVVWVQWYGDDLGPSSDSPARGMGAISSVVGEGGCFAASGDPIGDRVHAT